MGCHAGDKRDPPFMLKFPLLKKISGISAPVLPLVDFLMTIVADEEQISHLIEQMQGSLQWTMAARAMRRE